MTSLTAFGLSQIQRGTWWFDPSEPWRNNTAARKRSDENRRGLLRILRAAGQPIPMKQLADMAGLALMSVRNLMAPAIASGQVRREVIHGIIHLELVK